MQSPANNQRVAIIGAGAAGLSCALHLARSAPHVEVHLFEARKRIGGRAFTAQLGAAASGDKSVPVDMGAMFVCGIDPAPPVNPLLPLCTAHGIALRSCPSHGAHTSWRDARSGVLYDADDDGSGAAHSTQLACTAVSGARRPPPTAHQPSRRA